MTPKRKSPPLNAVQKRICKEVAQQATRQTREQLDRIEKLLRELVKQNNG